MKQFLLSLLLLALAVVGSPAQTVVLDFETPGTSTVFQYFGSSLDGQLTATAANPDPTGINTSPTVMVYVKPGDAQTWAGAFSNPDPAVPIDLVNNNQICVKVWMDHPGNLAIKLEGSTDGGDNWIQTQSNTVVGEWTELCFDASLPSIEAPNTPATGHTYARIVLFFDFGTAGTGADVTSYFDDVTLVPTMVTTTVLDFEAPETSTNFQYFGSTIDGQLTQVTANPAPGGINTSDSVVCYIKPAASQTWAGAFSNPDPEIDLDFTNNGQICLKVWMDHIGNVALKLEASTTGGDNWIQVVENTAVNTWEELCFDVSLPSAEGPFTAAAGHSYDRLVLFFDFGSSGMENDTVYFDDVVLKSGGGPQLRSVTFQIDMNDYSGAFAQVFVSGTFNNWSGDANPLADPDGDGVYETDILLPTGVHEYLFTVDNWADQETFTGLETCVVTDTSGQFHNRRLLVTDTATLAPVCFNSCYACGDEVQITFRVAMGDIAPHPEGVWLSGGGNFDVPGGPYRLEDFDGDGIWEITVPRNVGFSSFYAFANGPCFDFSCKENLEGQSCANPNNFNDRWLPPVTQDTIIETCYQQCTADLNCLIGTHEAARQSFEFRLLGNPSDDQVRVEWSDLTAQELQLSVVNSLGQRVQVVAVQAAAGQYRLPTASLSPGLYFIELTDGRRGGTQRFVKS
jgi:hypothetical protein